MTKGQRPQPFSAIAVPARRLVNSVRSCAPVRSRKRLMAQKDGR
jgi:hypothetical protein